MPSDAQPAELLKVLRGMYPHFIRCLRESELRGTEWFTLSYIEGHGRENGGESVMLTSDLTDMLTTLLYETEGGASGFITKLCNRRLLRRGHLTAVEKQGLFGSAAGSTAVIILGAEGQQKLRAFNGEVVRTFKRGGPAARLAFSGLARLTGPLGKIAALSPRRRSAGKPSA